MNSAALPNLGFILILVLFSFFWLVFSSRVTLALFRPVYRRLKVRKKINVDGLFKLGLYFQTTVLLISYAIFLILIPRILDLLYPPAVNPPVSMIALAIILFFCLNWVMGLRRWDQEIDRDPETQDNDSPERTT
jgi:O-antigen/teichoic acid export membrane protein